MAEDFVMNDSEETVAEQPLTAAEVDTDDEWVTDDEITGMNQESAEETENGQDQTGEDSEASDESDQPEAEQSEETGDDSSADLAAEMKETLEGFYDVKYLGESKRISKDDATVVPFIQKGMDYDRIRTERDALKAENSKNRGLLAVLQKQAEEAGMSVEDFIDYNAIEAMRKKDTGLDSMKALMKARNERLALEKQIQEEAEKEENERLAAEKAEKDKENAAKEARQAMFLEFARTYPGTAATDIPKEVWDGVQKGGNLTVLYTQHLARKFNTAERKQSQETKNRQRSAGSMKSQGGTRKMSADDIDALWDDGT